MSSPYAVFRNQHRNTCIRVPGPLRRGKPDESRTYYIPMDPLEVAVKSSPTAEFSHEFEVIPDYPVKRAAELYLYTETFKEFSPEARRHLEHLVADPAYNYSAEQFKPIRKPPVKEPETMSTTEAPKKTAPAKQPAAKKAPAAPAKKAAAPAKKAPAKKAPEAKAAPAKQPAAKKAPEVKASAKKAEGASSKTRLNDTDKIVVLEAVNPKRANTKAHETFELYKKAKTVGAFKAAGGDLGYLNFDVKSGFVKLDPAK